MRGSIFRRGTRWTAVIYLGKDPHGRKRQKWTTHDTRAQAEAWIARMLGARLDGRGLVASRQRLGEYLADWIRSRGATLAPLTQLQYDTRIRKHIAFELGAVPLRDLTPLHVQQWIIRLQEKHLQPSTVHAVYALLRSALADAVGAGLLPANPAERPGRQRAFLRPPRPRDPAVLDHELSRLFIAKVRRESPWWLLFTLDLQTGLRRGELLGLRRGDVLWSTRAVLTVRQTVSAIPGQGLVLGPPKTPSSRRAVQLTRELTRDLRLWIAQQDAAGYPGGPEQLLFAHPDGRPLRPESISRHFQRIIRRLTGQRIRLHDLRHTHASQLLADGVSIKIVQERLGHSRPGYTLQRYVHTIPTIQDAAVRAIERRMRERRPIRNEVPR